jgi:hypothetical protein
VIFSRSCFAEVLRMGIRDAAVACGHQGKGGGMLPRSGAGNSGGRHHPQSRFSGSVPARR